MRARGLAVTAAAAAVCVAGLAPGHAWAHSGLVRADPIAGATLGASPVTVKLSFSERPQPSLSTVHVLDSSGGEAASARPQAGDGQSLVVPVRKLKRGVYTVNWRAVSAVDGHASAGAFAFGVEVSPRNARVAVPDNESVSSGLEVVARWILIVGLVLLLGAAVAAAARFGGAQGTDLRLAGGGWLLAAAGLVVLAVAQRNTAGSSLSDLLETPVGEALLWRALAVLVAGTALLVAWRRPALRRTALAAAAVAALGCIVAHVGAGHAAAGSWPTAVTVVSQVAHFAAAGVWFGGLAALLVGVRGEPSAAKASAVRRFSAVALVAVLVVATTGTVRSVDELASWGDLFGTGYGRAVVAKVLLLALIVGLAAHNRRRGVPEATTNLRALRRTSRFELGLATGAIAAAALLGTLAPAVAGQPALTQGLSASGADFATTLRVRLTTVSSEPGPNRFDLRVEDYDSKAPVNADRVRLNFAPLDDPGVASTSLRLRPGAAGRYSGSGANFTFDGRWLVTALVQGGGDAVTVPLRLTVRGPTRSVSVLRPLDGPPAYTMQFQAEGYVQISPDPERAGPSTLRVAVLDFIEAEAQGSFVVTTQAEGGPVRQQSLRRIGPGSFESHLTLAAGRLKVVAIARTQDGLRLRAPFTLHIPER